MAATPARPAVTVHLVLILMTVLSYCNADFAEFPSNITLPVGSGMDAVFRCRHLTADTISWTVNGLSHRDFPEDIVPGSTSYHNGTRVFTLTIPARSEYNGTEVECVAIFFDGSPPQNTPSVILTVIDGENVLTTTAGIVSTTMAMDQETTLTEFAEYPSNITLSLESEVEAVFRCQHRLLDREISWRINGSLFSHFSDITRVSISENGTNRDTLIIPVKSEYNGTVVVCLAFSGDRSIREESPPAKLFVMSGPLQSVVNLIRNVSTLFWEAPFSLDLTNADPDIVYCVEVYNITCGRSLLISECDVMETSYTNDALLPGHIYEYTVTPRSNVEGASNGTSLTVTEKFLKFNDSSMRHSVSMMNSTKSEDSPRATTCDVQNISTRVAIRVHVDIYKAEAIKPVSYSISHISLDGISTHDEPLEAIATTETETSIVLKVAPLPFRRLWNITIFAHDCTHNPLTEEMELGTHDFHDIFITSPPDSGVVMVTGNIIPGSTSIGILVIVYSPNNDDSVHYHFVQHTDVQQPGVYPVIMGLSPNRYEVVVFVVEEDGRPFCRAAVSPRDVQIDGQKL